MGKIWGNIGEIMINICTIEKKAMTLQIRHKTNKQQIKYPLSRLLPIISILCKIECYFMSHIRKYICIAGITIFFLISSSFSFDIENNITMSMQDSCIEIQENYEYVPTSFNIPKSEILDDNDVIEGYDNEELIVNSEDIDQYTLDDILNANDSDEGIKETNSDINAKVSRDDWQLVLVNKQHPVPENYTFNLGTITGKMKCDVRIIDDLMDMLHAAKKAGIKLVICSPYRDYNRQTVLFNRKIDYYMEKGYSYLEAYKIASMTVTVPGASEHQIGLALDIVSNKYSALDTGFGETQAGKWLYEHGSEYGFILRYPKNKEYITGIQYEPWHFRYVGKTAAKEIMSNNLTLEEYLDQLD